MLDVLLINSPIYNEKVSFSESYLPPLGLGYIATFLKKNNVNVEILDCVHLNLILSDINQIILEKKPKFIGINVFTQNLEIVKSIIEGCAEKINFVIGGQVTKFIYNEIINWETNNRIDVVIGDGEYIMLDILNDNISQAPIIKYNHKRVFVVDNSSRYFPKDISDLNVDRGFFPKREVKNVYGLLESSIITSRGCIFNCAFCGGALSLNKNSKIRIKTKKSIIDEIKEIISDSGIHCIRILDDLFLKNKESIVDAIEIFEIFPNLKWRAMAHIHSFVKSYELLRRLRKSGCIELFIGIESGCNRIRKSINKLGSKNEVLKTISALLESGINVKGYFIFGFPDETVEDFEETYNLAFQLNEFSKETEGKFRISVFEFRPYHGTILYNRIICSQGKIGEMQRNLDIYNSGGRHQFNFHSGIYCKATKEELYYYINKSLSLNRREYDRDN